MNESLKVTFNNYPFNSHSSHLIKNVNQDFCYNELQIEFLNYTQHLYIILTILQVELSLTDNTLLNSQMCEPHQLH